MSDRAPSVSPHMLIEELKREGLIDEAALVSALGPNRNSDRLDVIQVALVERKLVSSRRLAALMGALSGMEVLDLQPVAINARVIPPATAKHAGAVAVQAQRPTVAFIEDSAQNVAEVASVVGRDDFDVWLVTAPHFVELYKKHYQEVRSDPRPEVGDVFGVLDEAISMDASDIHLSVDEPPVLRVSGELTRMQTRPLTAMWMRESIVTLLGESALERVEQDFNVDGAFPYGAVRFRINAGADMHGPTLAIRRLPSKIPTFDDISLPPAVRAFAEMERGLVLVTGPTGSGKSTTLAALLAHIGRNQSRHILTLEDPIEFVLPSKRAMVHQRELGESFTSFAAGLRQSLRQDPDVVLVGEARDPETIRAAVTAAETGALVFATVHTYDAVATLSRIVSTYPEGEQEQVRSQLAYVLKGVVSQTLLASPAGGRVAAYEVLVVTPAVANNLRKVDGLMSLRQVMVTGGRDGMQTMEQDLARLVRQGLVRESDAEFKARDLEEFHRQLATSV